MIYIDLTDKFKRHYIVIPPSTVIKPLVVFSHSIETADTEAIDLLIIGKNMNTKKLEALIASENEIYIATASELKKLLQELNETENEK